MVAFGRDRATYDANLSVAVNYTVASQADAPDTLSYGPQFITLAGQQKGQVTLGLARRLNNQPASLAAAVLAKQRMPNLFAFELGNEPECESRFSWSRPVESNVPICRLCKQFANHHRGGQRMEPGCRCCEPEVVVPDVLSVCA